LLTGEVVVLCGGPAAREDELFDFMDHEGSPLLVGRQGTDDTRKLIFADELFRMRVESESRPGFGSPQRLLKAARDDADHSATSQHSSWSKDVNIVSMPFLSKVLRFDIVCPAGDREPMHLEWYMSTAAVGDRPAVTVWCNLLTCFDKVFKEIPSKYRKQKYRYWSIGIGAQAAFARWGGPADELIKSKKSREAIVRLDAGALPMQPDVGPTEACTSARGLCILLLWSAHADQADGDPQTGDQLRCSSLLREVCAKFLSKLTWRAVSATGQCTLQVDRGTVSLEVLAGTARGREMCERTDY